jgi:hypothetical protein
MEHDIESDYIFVNTNDAPKPKSSLAIVKHVAHNAETMFIRFLWSRLMATAPRIACRLLLAYGFGFQTPSTMIYILTKALEYGFI